MRSVKKRAVLIACANKKLPHKAAAKDLYVSPLFKLCLKYAYQLKPDDIFVLSAKHNLLGLEKVIAPYNQTLNTMRAYEIERWASRVIKQLGKVCDIEKTEFVFLAGDKYRKYLLPHLKHTQIPLEGLRIGEQLGRLKKLTAAAKHTPRANVSKSRSKSKKSTAAECSAIHQWARSLKRHHFPFDESAIPQNGIYILFEKGERGHRGERIVRIGTHTGDHQLRARLKQHFLNPNKDRSVFRKNIGRALLNKNGDPFLEHWELDLTTRQAREKYATLIDFDYQQSVEKRVSKYIQKNFSFCVFEVKTKTQRLELESKLISTISLCKVCTPSARWLGKDSPKRKIAESGLWQVNELYKTPFDAKGVEQLKKLSTNANLGI